MKAIVVTCYVLHAVTWRRPAYQAFGPMNTGAFPLMAGNVHFLHQAGQQPHLSALPFALELRWAALPPFIM